MTGSNLILAAFAVLPLIAALLPAGIEPGTHEFAARFGGHQANEPGRTTRSINVFRSGRTAPSSKGGRTAF